MMQKLRSFFTHLDWIDWLLMVGFVAAFTWIGIELVDFPLWLAFPAVGIALIVLAKNRRDRMRGNTQESEPENGNK